MAWQGELKQRQQAEPGQVHHPPAMVVVRVPARTDAPAMGSGLWLAVGTEFPSPAFLEVWPWEGAAYAQGLLPYGALFIYF